jgi:hypothetical protein
MIFEEFLKKYNPPLGIEKMVYFKPVSVTVKNFNIYDSTNHSDPLVKEKNLLLSENPNYWEEHWHDQGPCSNWGILVKRWETESETDLRIRKNLKTAIKSQNLREKVTKDLDLSCCEFLSRNSSKKPVTILELILDEKLKKSLDT